MKINKIYLVTLILLAIFALSAVSAADNVTADSLATDEADDSISESLDGETNEILEYDLDDSALSAKKDSEMDVDFVTKDDDEIYPIDENSDILADNYNKDYLRVKFPEKVTGTLSLYIDDSFKADKKITAKTHYFFANTESYNLTQGTHSWEMKYSGDADYKPISLNGTFNLTYKNDSGISISFVKEDDNGNITVIDANKNMYVNDHDSDYIMVKFPNKVRGTIYLYIDGKLAAKKEITAKTHYIYVNTKSYNLSEGNHTWKIRYSGDEKHKAETSNGTFTLNPPSKAFVKKNPHMQVYIVGVGYSNTSDEEFEVTTDEEYFKVTFPKQVSGFLYMFIDGKSKAYKKITAKTHYIYTNTAKYNLTAGTHKWAIIYYGDDEYTTASEYGTLNVTITKKKVTIKKASPTISVSKTKTFKTKLYSKKYTVTLKANNKPLKNVNVYLTIKGKNYKKTFKAKTNKNGKATFYIKGLTKKGSYTGTINYKGNKNNKAITKKLSIKSTKTKCKITAGKSTVSKKVEYKIEQKTESDFNGFLDVSKAYDLLNQFRTEKGVWQWNPNNKDKTVFNTNAGNTLKPVEIDSKLEAGAKTRAMELAEIFDHVRPKNKSVYTAYPDEKDGYYTSGESIGKGQNTCERIIEAWKESDQPYLKQGHRRNMLNPYHDCVGMAAYRTGGVTYWVQIFATKV